jgi:hypothetical protein
VHVLLESRFHPRLEIQMDFRHSDNTRYWYLHQWLDPMLRVMEDEARSVEDIGGLCAASGVLSSLLLRPHAILSLSFKLLVAR